MPPPPQYLKKFMKFIMFIFQILATDENPELVSNSKDMFLVTKKTKYTKGYLW